LSDVHRNAFRIALLAEVSLAHNAVLFLDELPEFQRH
jgi:predicted ATPase with chaperone activity